MEPIIEVHDLTKHYGDFVAVDGIDFAIHSQEVFGFLGPNGAGKTTTMRMIYGFSPVTSGRLEVLGMDVNHRIREIKAQIGVVPQEDNLDPDLRVLQNLLVYARYFEIPRKIAQQRALELLELFQLSERCDSRIQELSGGMKRRLTIARALINEPQILILDEPTTGLDPQARHLVWTKLRYLKGQGVTMIITTHYMEEAAQLCDRLVIMDQGKILAEGAPQQLVAKHVGREVVELRLSEEAKRRVFDRVADLDVDVTVEDVGDTLYIFSRDGELMHQLDVDDLEVEGLIHRHATLEDVFLRLTGRALKE
ncbi:MAG: ABC transporter ATP-binding protein [Candidatus Bipolaricaulia bacterium]